MKGLEGEDLAIDVAQIGDPEADHMFMIVSGIDGAAGYVGSALQSWWLDQRAGSLPADGPRIALLHGVNPFGFSWVRRVNEDNVDINRNFVDWTDPPTNPEFDEIAELLVPTEWTEEVRAATTGELLGFAGRVGLDKFQQIVSGGQYDHPAAVFYGGSQPVWSHRWLREHLPAYVGSATRLAIIDIQVGLPESGHGEMVSHHAADDSGYTRGAAVWNGLRSATDRDTKASVLDGEWLSAVEAMLPDAEVTAAALEFGTVDVITMLQALRADAWLHSYGDPTAPEAAAIRQQMREGFAEDDQELLTKVIESFDEASTAAISALSV